MGYRKRIRKAYKKAYKQAYTKCRWVGVRVTARRRVRVTARRRAARRRVKHVSFNDQISSIRVFGHKHRRCYRTRHCRHYCYNVPDGSEKRKKAAEKKMKETVAKRKEKAAKAEKKQKEGEEGQGGQEKGAHVQRANGQEGEVWQEAEG